MDLDSMSGISVWYYRTNHHILLGLGFFFHETEIIITTLKNWKTKDNEMKIACTIGTRLGAQQLLHKFLLLLFTAIHFSLCSLD